MLVAPLFAGEPHRTLTLPSGQWHNFWTGEPVDGGTTIDIPATTRNVPVFVMDGAVLPLASITNSTADPASRNLEVRIFGDGRLPFSLLTPEGDALRLGWDATTHAGTVKQQGANRYTITAWIPGSHTESQPG
jgi:alpha-glucosidase (family GH31 glycosyl hydrolase)